MMVDLQGPAKAVLVALADEQHRIEPGAAVPLDRLAQLSDLKAEECLKQLGDLAQRGLVQVGRPGMPSGATITSSGRQEANALNVVPSSGAVAEFAEAIGEVGRAVLDAVVEGQLQIAGAAPTRSHVRTAVRNAITPKPDIERVNREIDGLLPSHLQPVGGSEPSCQVTLQGLLASRWGTNALQVIDQTLAYLREWKNKDPSLFRYSWGRLRKASGLPGQALNLAYLSITNAKLGRGLFESEGDGWWSTPPDLDILLEYKSALEYVRSVIHSDSTAVAWTKLAPHRPLAQGDPHYARRLDDGGTELAQAVRAGWRRIAVVGPMGVGKSTELAAAQQALSADRFAFRIGVDTTFDMHHIRVGEVFKHVLGRFLQEKPNPTVDLALKMGEEFVEGERRDFRRDLARKALRSTGKATIFIDGLEKADEAAARAVAEEFFGLGDDAEIVMVIPASLAYGPGAAVLGDDVRLFPVRPVLVWGEPKEAAISGRLFLREVALRHLERKSLRPDGPDARVLEIVDAACVASGGVPRVLLQLLRDTHRQAVIAHRVEPSLEDLRRAQADHGEYLRRSLVPGDIDVLTKAEGGEGTEVPLERKLRFLLQGLLLEYRRGEKTVMHMAPTLASTLGVSQARS